jgi:hypothetical protein
MRHPGASAVLFTLVWTTPLLSAQDSSGPELRRGLWRFERSFEYADGRAPGEPVASERCVDPAALVEEQLAMFRRMGCSAERSRASAREWRTAVTCDRPGLPRGSSSSVQTVGGADAYEVKILNAGEMAMPIVRERLVARRIGDC